MKIYHSDGEIILETKLNGNFLCLYTTKEADFSYDGGYSFENVETVVELNKDQAKILLKELKEFIKKDK